MLNRVKEKKLNEFVKWDIKIKKILMEIWNLLKFIEIILLKFYWLFLFCNMWLMKDLLILVTIFTR